MKTILLPLAACLFLGACSSSEREPADDGSTQGRLLRASLTDPRKSADKRSSFERQRETTGQKSSIASFFQRQSVKNRSFTGSKAYHSGDDFKAGRFNQSSKKSPAGDDAFSRAGQRFEQASQTPAETGKNFATSASRYQNQPATQEGDAFHDATDRFATSPVRDALKSQQKNERPKILPNPARQEGKTAYSEDEVKRMVNRN